MMKFFYFEMHTLLYALFDWSEFTGRGHGFIAIIFILKLIFVIKSLLIMCDFLTFWPPTVSLNLWIFPPQQNKARTKKNH